MKFFDAHFHIVDPNFQLTPNHGYLPPEFTIKDYLGKLSGHQLIGGAVVSGSFQGFDQAYLLDALNKLGNGFYGVANIPVTMDDQQLQKLNSQGVKAVRFNLKRGGSEDIKHLEYLSHKLYREFGWHTELYLDSKDIKDLFPVLTKLYSFSIDHLGLTDSGTSDLLKLVTMGARIKATGFGRINFQPLPVMKRIMELNSEALMFGTDLPSTRAKIPFSSEDFAVISDHFSQKDQDKIFFKNALEWYGR